MARVLKCVPMYWPHSLQALALPRKGRFIRMYQRQTKTNPFVLSMAEREQTYRLHQRQLGQSAKERRRIIHSWRKGVVNPNLWSLNPPHLTSQS